MKAFVIGLIMGILIGIGAYWFFAGERITPSVQKTEQRAAEQAEKARTLAQQAGEQAKQALAGSMEALELRAEDIQKELAEKGRVVRRKAHDIGEAATSAALDTRATAEIKAKLATDPNLSAFSISVSTTAGRVTLSGTVSSYELIGKAMTLALKTDGVREVVSTLQVK